MQKALPGFGRFLGAFPLYSARWEYGWCGHKKTATLADYVFDANKKRARATGAGAVFEADEFQTDLLGPQR